MNYEEKTISKELVYKGNIITVEKQIVTLPDGREASRDIVLHPGASAVVPINENNEIYMVTQYRKPLEKVCLEIPAGKLDPGEDPKVCAERELKEETGLEAENIRHLASIETSAGFCNEVIHIYAATGLKQGEACADEDEFISSEKIHINQLVDMILTHKITDAKSVVGILLAEKMIKGEI